MDSSSQVKSIQPKSKQIRNKSGKVNHQLSQKVIGMNNITTIPDDKEIKVEKALLDLNELKTQMFTEK